MKKILILLFILLIPITIFAQMSDMQVQDYVKNEVAKGTSQEAIVNNLILKGVTPDQIERIRKQTEQQKQTTASGYRQRDKNAVLRTNPSPNKFNDDSISYTISKNIFGKNIFNQKNLSFISEINIPTPVDYKLGPGDEIAIDIWGASQESFRKTISPEGSIVVDYLGPISLNGMTIEEANKYVSKKFASIYGLDEYGGASHIKLTLGQIRTIQINVMGEVNVPGTYAVSSLSSVFHALYLAGGINDIGSLRQIQLYRKGKLVTTIDIYDYLLNGKSNNEIRLFDSDIIIVPPYISLVNISGPVKRPMYYEMNTQETLNDVIRYAGGFSGDAYKEKLTLVRKTGEYDKIFSINAENFSNFKISDGDNIIIKSGLSLYENRVEIIGSVYRPGFYEIGGDVKTVKDLIEISGGLKGNAFYERAILTRECEDLSLETLALNLNEIFSGDSPDIKLRKNDILLITSNKIETDLGSFKIFGMIANPGSYAFIENTTIKDIILKAGGLLSSASTAKIDVSRRIIDPFSTTNPDKIAETYTFDIKEGLIANDKDNFILKPYDQIYIRKSPGYSEQKDVIVEGEVLFPGRYTLEVKEQRISDIIQRTGNLTEHAFAKGAKLMRRRSKEEINKQLKSLEMIARGSMEDSISKENMDIDSVYFIGIELDKAIENPGSEFDLVLKSGDRLIIPEFDNTIKIDGAVMYPNTVLFKKGKSLSYYIEQAGGYNDVAEKKKAYIVYMNGTVAKAKNWDKNLLQPGCEIIVPIKEKKEKMTLAQTISVGSSIASMASVVALLINALTK